MQLALRENRTLVVTSRILQKFCVLVPCALEPVHGEDGHFKPDKGIDLKRNSDYFFKVDGYPKGADAAAQEPFYALAGCELPNPAGEWDDKGWRHRCLYSRLIRSLIVGGSSGGGKLQVEKEWLRQYYIGNKIRFNQVMAVDKHQSEPIFDYVIHVRTLGLIEDMANKDGLPTDPEGKTDAFLASEGFEQMVNCFAHEIAGGVAAAVKKGARFKGRARNDLRIYVATDAAGIRQSFSERLQKAVAARLNGGGGETDEGAAVSSAANATAREPLARASSAGGRGFARRRRPASSAEVTQGAAALRLPELLPSEAAAALATAPRRRRLAVTSPASAKESRWSVSVDYFTQDIPPAHFWIWTTPMNQMTEENWQRLSGTTAEWLFMAQGHTMLTVKGLKGGERALPSSFAMSSAAFGQTKRVKFLRSSKPDRKGQCDMAEISSFS